MFNFSATSDKLALKKKKKKKKKSAALTRHFRLRKCNNVDISQRNYLTEKCCESWTTFMDLCYLSPFVNLDVIDQFRI